MKVRITVLIGLILGAIWAANLIVTHYGPSSTPYVAFFLIAVPLVARDRLHDLFGKYRALKMAALILAGAGLAYLVNHDAAQVAKASFFAFAAAESVDAVSYHLLRRREWLERSNASNLLGAAVDSVVFISVAFGFSWAIVFAQFVAKVAGGLVWSLVLRYTARPQVEAA